jgi:hypothetical protein
MVHITFLGLLYTLEIADFNVCNDAQLSIPDICSGLLVCLTSHLLVLTLPVVFLTDPGICLTQSTIST